MFDVALKSFEIGSSTGEFTSQSARPIHSYKKSLEPSQRQALKARFARRSPTEAHEFKMSANRQKFPYLKFDFKTNLSAVKEWKLFEGDEGCTRVDQEGICLGMDKPAHVCTAPGPNAPQGPVLVEAGKQISGWFKSTPAGPQAPARTSVKEPEGPLLVEAWKQIQAWSNPKADAKAKLSPPPFDIQDIPTVMDAILKWPKSAALMRQFFDGDLNYSRTHEAERDAINQDGNYYAPVNRPGF